MDSIEKDSPGKSDGGFMYDLIWKARSTGKKHLWCVVFLLSALSFFKSLSIWIGVWIGMELLGFSTASFKFFLSLVVPLYFVFECYTDRSKVIEFASNMYGIAADMKRISASLMTRVMFVLAGGSAVIAALGVWLFWKGRLQKLTMTELDVIGSIFSRSGMLVRAQRIFQEMSKRYERRNDRRNTLRETEAISVSYALGCKWMSACDSTGCNDYQQAYLLAIIHDVITRYPDLGPETRIRLYEALGNKTEMEESERQIAAKVN